MPCSGSLISIPPQYVYVPRETIGDGQNHERGIVHAISTENNRDLKFHVLFEAGFHYSDLLLDSLFWKETPTKPAYPFDHLQPYQCLSDLAEAHILPLLENMRVRTKGIAEDGTYLFTLQFNGRDTWQNLPEQRKLIHFVKLDNGQFAALPNNYLLWCDPAVTSAEPDWPDWLKRNKEE